MKIVNFLLQSSTTEKYPKHLSELYPRNTQEIGSTDASKGESTQENTKKEPFNKTARAILNSIIVQPTLTREMLAEQLGLSDSTVKKYLKIFKDIGLIDRIGPNKGGYWEVKK